MSRKKIEIPVIPEDVLIPQPEFEITLQGHIQYDGQPHTLVTYKTDATSLDNVFLAVGDFLRAMGYNFDGHIGVIDESKTD